MLPRSPLFIYASRIDLPHALRPSRWADALPHARWEVQQLPLNLFRVVLTSSPSPTFVHAAQILPRACLVQTRLLARYLLASLSRLSRLSPPLRTPPPRVGTALLFGRERLQRMQGQDNMHHR